MASPAKLLTSLFLLLAAALVLSCRRDGADSQARPLILANSAEPPSLDLHVVTGQPELRVLGAMYEGLVIRGLKDAAVRPGVARTWETTPDGLTYTFRLRQTRWSDGSPLTAGDFVRSWRRFIDP